MMAAGLGLGINKRFNGEINNMKKRFLPGFILILSISLFGCNANTDVDSAITSIIPLKFELVTIEQDIQKLKANEIKEILKEVLLPHGKVFIYTKKNDQEYLYGGFSTEQSLYNLGKIGNLIYLDVTSITIHQEFNDTPAVRIDGAHGANYPQSNYFLFESSFPKKILTVDGHATEFDLDQDGTVEIISSIGTTTVTSIYKLTGEHFLVADLNKSLDALSVIFKNEDNPFFLAYFKDKTTKEFKFTEDGLKLVESQ